MARHTENSPVLKQDSTGRLTRQYRRDGKGSEVVRKLEEGLRQELIDECARATDQNWKDCEKSAVDKCPALPSKPSPADAKKRDLELLAKALDCEKGAQCEYQACLAAANSASNTTDYIRAWSACMATP
jgi:hypothetical protein